MPPQLNSSNQWNQQQADVSDLFRDLGLDDNPRVPAPMFEPHFWGAVEDEHRGNNPNVVACHYREGFDEHRGQPSHPREGLEEERRFVRSYPRPTRQPEYNELWE